MQSLNMRMQIKQGCGSDTTSNPGYIKQTLSQYELGLQ